MSTATSQAERWARVGLTCVLEPAEVPIAALVAAEGAEAVWASLLARSGPRGDRARSVVPQEVLARARALGQRFVVPGDDEWPDGVDDLAHIAPVGERGGPPHGLWVKGPGSLNEWCGDAVAVVGSRAATGYGVDLAASLAGDLAERGTTIVSGGAFGIDVAAHRAALAVAGRTICVSAAGLDVAYPRAHSALFERLGREHLMVSEGPPGAAPLRARFLTRNRLIAALSGGTIIVEAARRSGARNTVSWANALSRVVMAVPGPVHSAQSATPHRLIRDHEAELVGDADDVRELLAASGVLPPPPDPGGPARVRDDLPGPTLAVLEAFPARSAISTEEVAQRAGVDVAAALVGLMHLSDLDLVVSDGPLWRLAPGAVRR